MSDKDFVLNNLHSVVQEVEWELVTAILKDDSESTNRTKTLKIPILEDGVIHHITLRVTIEYETE